MGMNGTYLDALAVYGDSIVAYIGLTDSGVEISGGSPAYIRKAVTWSGPAAGDGKIFPNGNIVFDIPAGATVDGWVGYSAESAGTAYGGQVLTAEAFAAQGTYTLLAASTYIDHDAS